jgi:RNA polymerase sigma factor (sigma-70 family)
MNNGGNRARAMSVASKQATGRFCRTSYFFSSGECLMARYRFWLYKKDRKGRPIDKTFLKIAEEIGPDLAPYGQKEVDGESASNGKLQSAVEAASQVTQNSTIENPPRCWISIYKRIVDKFLAREKRLVPADDLFLEVLANTDGIASFEDAIHDRLLVEKILKAMDPDTRRICRWRLQGYSMREIAKELKITPDCLSVRYRRGLRKAVSEVLHQKRD